MPCGKKYVRIRAKDVGRPGHHYILVGIRRTRGPRGGRTERIGGLRKYKRRKRSKKKNLVDFVMEKLEELGSGW